MKHYTDDKLAEFINRYYTPQDAKVKLIIKSNQCDKNGECMIYVRMRRYNPLKRKDEMEKLLATGIRVNPKYWSSKKEEVLKKDFEYHQKNQIIIDKKTKVLNYIYNPDIDYVFAKLDKMEFAMIDPDILAHINNLDVDVRLKADILKDLLSMTPEEQEFMLSSILLPIKEDEDTEE